jgi:hypothetical protein
MKYARRSFIALAGAAVLAINLATGASSALAASGGTHASATHLASAAELTQLKPDSGLKPDLALCAGKANEPEFNSSHSAITSVAFIDDCTTTPVSCLKRADLQAESENTNGWINVATGPTTTGCTEANASIVSEPCEETSIGWIYRTEGVFKVVFSDGGVDDGSDISGTVSGGWGCGAGY